MEKATATTERLAPELAEPCSLKKEMKDVGESSQRESMRKNEPVDSTLSQLEASLRLSFSDDWSEESLPSERSMFESFLQSSDINCSFHESRLGSWYARHKAVKNGKLQ